MWTKCVLQTLQHGMLWTNCGLRTLCDGRMWTNCYSQTLVMEDCGQTIFCGHFVMVSCGHNVMWTVYGALHDWCSPKQRPIQYSVHLPSGSGFPSAPGSGSVMTTSPSGSADAMVTMCCLVHLCHRGILLTIYIYIWCGPSPQGQQPSLCCQFHPSVRLC